MAVSQTGSLIKVSSTAMGFALISTKVDLSLTLVILILFSLVHGVIAYQNIRGKKDENIEFAFIDFVILFVVALSTGVMFTALGILTEQSEMFIYICTMVGSLLGIRGLDFVIKFITKKLGSEVSLYDNSKPGK